MPKFCIECGNELTSEAKFCSNCGKEQVEQKEQNISLQKTTSPAAINLKTAFSLISRVEDELINNRRIAGLDGELNDAVILIEQARNIDSNVVLVGEESGKILCCNDLLSHVFFLRGRIKFNLLFIHKMVGPSGQLEYKKTQELFHKSYELRQDSSSLYYEASCIYYQVYTKSLVGCMIKGLNGEEVKFKPFSPHEGRELAYNSFQKVIDLYPDHEYAIEARKMQMKIDL